MHSHREEFQMVVCTLRQIQPLICQKIPSLHEHLLTRCFSSAFAIQIKVWCLSKRANSIARPGCLVVIGSTMPIASVVPDCKVILIPFESDLGIVVLCHKVEKVAEEKIGLVFCNAIDTLGEALVDIYRLPSSDSFACPVSKFRIPSGYAIHSRFVRITGWIACRSDP